MDPNADASSRAVSTVFKQKKKKTGKQSKGQMQKKIQNPKYYRQNTGSTGITSREIRQDEGTLRNTMNKQRKRGAHGA